jgi:hypothetical protein
LNFYLAGTTLGERSLCGAEGVARATGNARATAPAISSRPNPKTAFGTTDPGKGGQSCVEVSGTAVAFNRSAVEETWPFKAGAADQRSATAPETSGVEPEVPENPPT